MKKFLFLFLPVLFLLSPFISIAQQADAEVKLPNDPAVITGTLENGLKYYIRQNTKPEKRVEFRLLLNAGSVLEDDDQQGLAHFIEHMAFNGTEDFSKNDLISFLEKSGLNFGADLNAYTSFDETVYMFQMPSDRQGLIDSAFLVLENWAHKLSFDDEEIDKERGVVHEEWRLGLGAQDRMMKEYIPVIFKDSRYAERLPIGKMSVIDSCEYDVVKRFYRDWYRPDLMAVVVVGDIDPAMAEEKIKTHFKDLVSPKEKRERTVFNIPNNDVPLVTVATDKEATATMAVLIRKLDKFQVKTIGNFRTKLTLDLFLEVLNARLFEITQDPDAPFMYSSSGYGGFVARSLDAFFLSAMVKENKINEALTEMALENRRIKRYGVTEAELERQKAQMLSNIDKALEEKDKTESRVFVREYLANFLENEAFPGIEYEAGLVKRFLPGITVDEVNQMAYYVGKQNNLIVLVTAPDNEEVVIPTEEEILAAVMASDTMQLEAYTEEILQESLISEELTGGSIVKTTEDGEFGITTIELENGARVILKPTDFKNDEILMTSFGLGGTSLAPDDKFISAGFADYIISMSGVGEFDNVSLQKFLTGKNVSVKPKIDTLSQGISGKSVKKDLETMLQLTYLYFTQPRKDTTAFKTFKSQMLNQFKFMMANPEVVFYDTVYKLATQNDPRTIIIPTEDQLNAIRLDDAYAFYKDRFAGANGFTFVFTGSFDVEEIKPLLSKYIGSLPSEGDAETWKDVSPKFPAGITEAVIHKGTEPKSRVILLMNQPFELGSTNRLQMKLLMKILNIRMRESMREDQGGVYGVRARASINKYPKPEISIMVGWGCAPENVDQLVKTVFAEIDTLQMNGPTEINLQKAKETTIRDLETSFKKNKFWLNKLKSAQYNGDDLMGFGEISKSLESVSIKQLQEMANTYFPKDHYLKVVLMPEEEKTE